VVSQPAELSNSALHGAIAAAAGNGRLEQILRRGAQMGAGDQGAGISVELAG
jgi:DNA-binding GntR family transcriptional regulator